MHLMPRHLLLSFAGAAALLQLSCGREVTGPGDGNGERVARLALDPRLPALVGAEGEVQGISSVVPFDRVRVVATRQDESVAYDRTVPFPSTADSIALGVAIPLRTGDTEGVGVDLRLAYVDAQGDTVFRAGPVTAVATIGAPSQPVPLPVRYTGVGSGATRVVLTPDTATVLAGTSTTFIAQARDTTGAIAGTPLYVYSPDSARALIPNPAVATVQWKPSRGIARIIALHPSGALADTSVIAVTLPATKLVLASGGGQSALGSTALSAPIVLRTLAADDVPVPGVVVDFAVTSGGGTITTLKDTSDANGQVSTNWTLGTFIGTQTISASAAGLTPSPQTITAVANAGPTGVALNITSPIGASRYFAIVTGGGIATEVVAKINPGFARTATLNVPLPAGNGYTIYVLAADSLTPRPDSLPVVSAGTKFTGINVPAGNTIPLTAALGAVNVSGTVPTTLGAGEIFVADVTLTDPSGLFYSFFTGVNLYRSDSIVSVDRSGSAISVGGAQILNATQKRFTASVFRPTVPGTIYSQFGGGIALSDRSVIFYVVGPSRQRNENLLATTVTPATTGIRVNVTSPVGVTRFVVGVDTGAGPIAWGGTTGTGLTSATIDVPVPAGNNYRVRIAALDDFGFSQLTLALLAGLRAGGTVGGVNVVSQGFTPTPVTLVTQTTAAGVPTIGTSGVGIAFSGTMRDPSLFNANASCLMRYSTAGPIVGTNLGTLLTTGCTISNRQSDGTYTVTGSFPPITGPTTLHTHVFTSVIGFQANGARVEMVHQNIAVTTINLP
jgi:hypothetical protein